MLFAKLKVLVKIFAYFITKVVIWTPLAFIMNGFEGIRVLHTDFVEYCDYEWNRIRVEELKCRIAEYSDKSKVCQHFKVEVPLDYHIYPDEIAVKIGRDEIAMRKDSFSPYNSTISYTVSNEASQFFGVTITYDELVRLNASLSSIKHSHFGNCFYKYTYT